MLIPTIAEKEAANRVSYGITLLQERVPEDWEAFLARYTSELPLRTDEGTSAEFVLAQVSSAAGVPLAENLNRFWSYHRSLELTVDQLEQGGFYLGRNFGPNPDPVTADMLEQAWRGQIDAIVRNHRVLTSLAA